jgi:starch phosphorylase
VSKNVDRHPSSAVCGYFPRALPQGIEVLGELALDTRWSWNHEADQLWKTIDPELWEATGNPWLILQSVSVRRLEQLARDDGFMNELSRLRNSREAYLRRRPWFDANHEQSALNTVAYFSMEFGLSEALPLYAGGLGILAGDHLKAASDLGVPLCGVGLLYQRGYFRQVIGADSKQVALFPYNNPAMLPIAPIRDAEGEWLKVSLELPGRKLHLRGWQVVVGRSMLYLLDSNDPLNRPADRGITGELYGGGPETRLLQELVLGMGGWRLLRELGVNCEVCHLNEGHAAFAILERAREFMRSAGCEFSAALHCTRAGNIFTTHTPVAAGFDRFAPALVSDYLGEYADDVGIGISELLALGRANPNDSQEPFNMAYLAMHGCGRANAVSQLHRRVSRRIFQPLFPRQPDAQVPIDYITNGVHVPSWDSAQADTFWTKNCGKSRWMGTLQELEDAVRGASDESFWNLRVESRKALVNALRKRRLRPRVRVDDIRTAQIDLFNADALTLGLARRFTGYKRPNLLLFDPQRLTRILTNSERPVQLVIAGKAHPADSEGQNMVREWIEYTARPEVQGRAVFIEDYDLAVAAELVEGVDLWINTPRRPWEACGTSGMKLLVNGGLNLSVLDGWWAEAYSPEVGWALGDGQEHDHSPAQDVEEARQLYRLLEDEVIPAFYERDAKGLPAKWIARVRASMATLTPRFSSNRMIREYVQYYLAAADRLRRRAANSAALTRELEQWYSSLKHHWAEIRFGNLQFVDHDHERMARVEVDPGGIDPDFIAVELYADAVGDAVSECIPMVRRSALGHAWIYEATLGTVRSREDYTPRVVPVHPEAIIPLEAPEILWFR